MAEESEFHIRMTEHNFPLTKAPSDKPLLIDMAICLTACKWGSGDCGPQMLEHLLLTLAESMEKPKYLILMDSAVFLVTDNTLLECQDALDKLDAAGVKILVSEASARHYGQIACIRKGAVVKFQDIAKLLLSVERFVSL